MPRKRPAHRFGAHMSIAGGLHKAIEAAAALGMETVQIFTKNSNQWACKPLEEAQLRQWADSLSQHGLIAPVAHASYLINLAAPAEDLWNKSVEALIVEWRRADALQLEGLVVHPGAYTTSDEPTGLERIAAGVQRAIEAVEPQHCTLLLENTAGQGSCLGHSFRQLGQLVERIDGGDAIGVCLDTCHAFAAGYGINEPSEFRAMMQEIDGELPAGAIRALHLNDSKKPRGSRVDRHEHIGRGEIGDAGFQLVMSDPVLSQLPGYLETPKGTDEESGEDWDAINLRRLRQIAGN